MKDYAALRLSDYRKLTVQGQKLTDYNWEDIQEFDSKDEAIKFAKEYRKALGKEFLIIYDTNGYGIEPYKHR